MDASDAIAMWLAEGHIDDELAARLRASLAEREEPERANRLIWLLVSIGAVLIGGGLLLFIASQWDQSSPSRRLALLFGIYLIIVAGAAVAERQRLDITARGLWFLSSIAVGVNVFLVGQIFNLTLNYWQGTLLWLIATLVMGWASPSSAQGWLAVPLGLLTLGWFSVPSSRFFDQGAFLFEPAGLRPLLPLVGLALVGVALLLAPTSFSWLARPAAVFGAVLVAVPITISTFHPEAFGWIFGIELRLFHVVVGLICIALVALAWWKQPLTPLAIGFAVVAVLLVALLPQVEGERFDEATVSWLAPAFDDSEALFFLYNAVIFGLALATIVVGQHYKIRALVNVGFAMVAVLLVAVYIGRLAGALPTSLAVILGGVLLVGGAIFLERKRRALTAEAAPSMREVDR
ncbi:MAG: DUF2157 domain-containing protein [Acidimicrobiia bacterium]|nr:DUF2157 domain-containing protein [Acidimicrobiia bacterium]